MINCSHGTKSLRSQTKRLFALSSGVQLVILHQAHLISNLIIVFSHRASVCPNCLSNGALAGNFRMLPHIGGDGFLLLADCIQKDVDVRLGITVCDAAEGDCNSRVCLSPALTARTPERIR